MPPTVSGNSSSTVARLGNNVQVPYHERFGQNSTSGYAASVLYGISLVLCLSQISVSLGQSVIVLVLMPCRGVCGTFYWTHSVNCTIICTSPLSLEDMRVDTKKNLNHYYFCTRFRLAPRFVSLSLPYHTQNVYIICTCTFLQIIKKATDTTVF